MALGEGARSEKATAFGGATPLGAHIRREFFGREKVWPHPSLPKRLPNARLRRSYVSFRRLLRKERVSTPIAESVPTGVCGGARKGFIGQSPGQSRSRGQNNHGLVQHRPLSFDATVRLDDCIPTPGATLSLLLSNGLVCRNPEPGSPFLGASENFGILWHRSRRRSAGR
jgi:hypothetical protein